MNTILMNSKNSGTWILKIVRHRLLLNLTDKIKLKKSDKYVALSNFSKNIGKNISKNLRGKYSQKLLDHAKKSATDALKIC